MSRSASKGAAGPDDRDPLEVTVDPPGHRFRSIRLAVIATLCALVPLVLLAVLTTDRAVDVVEDEVSARLQLTTELSSELLAGRLGAIIALVEASAARPGLVDAVAGGDPARFDDAEIQEELATLASANAGMAGSGLLDLDGVLRGTPTAPELIGDSFANRDYYVGLVSAGETYASEAFQSAQSGNPFVLTIATYVRGEAGSGSDGPARAILIAGVYLDYVQTLVDEVAAVQGVRLWVADQHGTVLATPSGRPPDLVAIQDLSIGSTMLSPRGDPGEIDLDGTAMMVVAHEVETLGWTVVAAIPVAQAQAGADSIRDAVGAVGIPLFLVVAVGIALLVRSQRLQWRAEAAAQAARDAAREASQMKTEFLSRMSHELRTPLNSILGFAQLLEMGDRTATERDSVGHILKAGRHLLDLINEVLDISRIESGTIALSMEPVLMAEIVAETLDIVRPTADQRSVVIENRVDLASHDYALADRQRLKQILLNLLSNAIKYNRPGGRVTVACERSEPGLMRLGVTDTGPGLDEALLGKLFTPFERLGAEQTEVEGTGIGLALSRRLAEALGGELGVESTVGVGSTFWVELPVVEGPVERHERLNDHVGPTSAGPEAPGEHKVLYIEDNLANLDLVERIIAHRESLTVIPCMQGSLAVELAAEHQPALVLLDLHLADMSGEEVLRRLRENEATASIPVVVVSADATSGQVRKLIEAGADAYIAKPIIVVELLRTIDSLIT